jgi:hypothetical protein
VTVTFTAFGSNAAAGEPDALEDLDEGEGGVAAEAVGVAGVSTDGEPVKVGCVDAAGEQAASARNTTAEAAARIRDIGRC